MLPASEADADARSATHDLLTQGVSAQHRSLDRHPILRKLLSRQLTAADYMAAMQRLRCCYELLEPALLACENTLEGPGLSGFERYMARLPQLDRDLSYLSADQCVHGQIPRERVHYSGSTVTITSLAAYLGVRYVLEGSTQGGVVIARSLERQLPSVTHRSFEFWRQQRLLALRWPAFLAVLAGLDGHAQEQSRALAAARDTFALFLIVFNGN